MLASQCLFSFVYTVLAILSKFDLAAWLIGAVFMAANVAFLFLTLSGMGDGPFVWVGHMGEKCSFILAQQGHMNQCEDS